MGDLNLKVADSEYEALSSSLMGKYATYGIFLEQFFQSYINILTEICQNAISDGEIANNLQAFVETASMLQGQFSSLVQSIASFSKDFLDEVEIADDHVYEG